MPTSMSSEKRQRRSKRTLSKIGVGKCFTIAQLVVVFAVATLVFCSTTVSSKAPSLSPQHRRQAGPRSNRNYKTVLPVASTRSQEAAWVSGFKNSLASGLAAGCSKLLLAPFDTIKTMQQAALVSGGVPLSISKAAQEILKRPKGFLEFYVSPNRLESSSSLEIVLY